MAWTLSKTSNCMPIGPSFLPTDYAFRFHDVLEQY